MNVLNVMSWLSYWVLFFYALLTSVDCTTIGQHQADLLNNVFTANEREVRPICQVDEPVTVKIGLAVRQIIELDEPKQILYLNAWLRLVWFDCNLQWNASDYGGIDNLIVPYQKVWVPDITLYDNAGEELEGFKDFMINVASDGMCYYNFPTVIKVLCKIDVTYFPFDIQSCPLKFGSWAHHGLEINATQKDAAGDISSFVPNTEWKILSVPVKTNVLMYQCCPEPYPDVTFYVTIERKPLFYVLNLLFPCVLISAVALLGFVLPPDAGEKVSLEITVLLSLAVFLLVVSETLPASSENFPYIGMYFAMAMLLVSLSTLLTVIVLNVHYKGHLSRPVPKWLRKFAFDYLGRVLMIHQESSAVCPEASNEHKRPDRNGIINENYQGETHINGFQEYQNKQRSDCNGNGDVNNIPLGSEFFERPVTDTPEPDGYTPVTPFVHPSLQPLMSVMKQQLHLLEKEDIRKDSKIRHDHLLSEWKKLGAIMDRFFLIIFVLIATISSFAILLQLQ